MQTEKGLSKYQIFQGTVKWLKGLPPRWNEVTSLTDHQWREIKCWFSNLDTEDEEELIERLQDLADANWEEAPPQDETSKSWLESLPHDSDHTHFPSRPGGVHGP